MNPIHPLLESGMCEFQLKKDVQDADQYLTKKASQTIQRPMPLSPASKNLNKTPL